MFEMIIDSNKDIVEAFIDGKKELYDFCETGELSEAKKIAVEWAAPNYIGSSNIYFVNGTENNPKETHHFFRK